jgi:WD40 repeat protein
MAPYVPTRFIEEMQGVAAGSGVTYDALRRFHAIPLVADYACSIIAVWGAASANGHLYQIRNLDWVKDGGLQNYPLIVAYLPQTGVAHVNIGFAGMVGSNTGLNTEGIALSEKGASPGSDYPFNLNGLHFAVLFRNILQDAHSLDQALSIVNATQRIKKYRYVIGDAGKPAGVKIKAYAPDNILNIWTDNDPTDELFPNVLPNIVYMTMNNAAAWNNFNANYGLYTYGPMIALSRLVASPGGNLMNVVYDATMREMWVAYAEGSQDASTRPYVHFNLNDYLPLQGALIQEDFEGYQVGPGVPPVWFEGYKGPGATWEVIDLGGNKVLKGVSGPPGGGGAGATGPYHPSGRFVENFEMQVSLRVESGEGGGIGIGQFDRRQYAGNAYYVSVSVSQSAVALLEEGLSAGRQLLGIVSSPDVTVSTGQWYDVRMVSTGTTFQVWFRPHSSDPWEESEKIIEVAQDALHPGHKSYVEGFAGCWTQEWSGPSTVLFDDFRLEAAPFPAAEEYGDNFEDQARSLANWSQGWCTLDFPTAGGSHVARLTTDPATDWDPAWSPDGSEIAFGSNRTGTWHVWAIRPDGTGLRRITPDEAPGLTPAWSPDGNRLVYQPVWGGLRIISKDGTGLLELPVGGAIPAWSPDGTRIAFNGGPPAPSPPVPNDIYVINVDGTGLTQVTIDDPPNTWLDSHAAWSPDGSEIAFVSNRGGRFAIWAIHPDGTGLRHIVDVSAGDWAAEPAWSPNGQWISYQYAGDVWAVDRDGGRRYRLIDGGAWDGSWSPDGSRFAFTSARSGNEDIWVADAPAYPGHAPGDDVDGGQVARITTGDDTGGILLGQGKQYYTHDFVLRTSTYVDDSVSGGIGWGLEFTATAATDFHIEVKRAGGNITLDFDEEQNSTSGTDETQLAMWTAALPIDWYTIEVRADYRYYRVWWWRRGDPKPANPVIAVRQDVAHPGYRLVNLGAVGLWQNGYRIACFDDFYFHGTAAPAVNTPEGSNVAVQPEPGMNLTFDNVSEGGTATVETSTTAPGGGPGGLEFQGLYYDINTTCVYSGPVTICLSYDDTGMTPEQEASLRLMHWVTADQVWRDITTSVDTVNNVICGSADSLSVFALATFPVFDGFLQPINMPPSLMSVFKQKSTIPVKFRLLDPATGAPVPNVAATIWCQRVAGGVPNPVNEPVYATQPDGGNAFRYDPTAGQYIFNLSTKSLTAGVYRIHASIMGGLMDRWVDVALK